MTTHRLVVVGLLLLCLSPSLSTQQAPVRDNRPAAQTGTAVIRGRVFAADTQRPLRRARITLNAPELGGQARTTSTSLDGRFEIRDLPAGRYTLSVTRSGYLQLSYGQTRPFEQGRPLQLEDKEVLQNVDFTLPRMSLITGRIVDETGEPVSGVNVYPLRTMFFEGQRKLVPATGRITTDDIGEYRILGLTPGTYYVVADLRETWTVAENGVDRVVGYSPTYFPGVTDVANARRITVGVGEEASSIDFALVPGRAASVFGTAFDSRGRPLVGRRVSLQQEVRGPGFGSFSGVNGTSGGTIAADGTFRITDLAPGEYKLRLSAPVVIGTATVQEAAVATVVIVDGVNVDNVSLVTTAGWTMTGTVISENGQPPTLARDRITVAAQMDDGDLSRAAIGQGGPENGRVRDDWSFSVGNAIGRARLRVTVPDGWMVKAILQEGRDVTEDFLDPRGRETLAGLQVVVSDRLNAVTGQLADERGTPLQNGTVIVFSSESAKWFENSRSIRATRPDQQGRYQIRGLPPGEYLAVAIDYVEQGTWNDPEFLESLRSVAQRFRLEETGTQALTLRLVTP